MTSAVRRRLHSRLIAWGSICGLPSVLNPSEVFLKGLPPPSETDSAKVARFRNEERQRVVSSEPFYDMVSIAAGAKHFAMVTRDGHVVLMGSNRYGQVGQPTQSQDPRQEAMPYFYDLDFVEDVKVSDGCADTTNRSGGRSAIAESEGTKMKRIASADDRSTSSSEGGHVERGQIDHSPSLPMRAPNAVVCGCNFTLAYFRGPASAAQPPAGYAVGNNHHGQLGLGHKNVLDNRHGFGTWGDGTLERVPWLRAEHQLVQDEATKKKVDANATSREGGDITVCGGEKTFGIRNVVCGYNHTIIHMLSGRLYSCGTNTCGELGIGSRSAPMWPTRLTFFEEKSLRVKSIAAGSSFTVFVTTCGRVYGCGACQQGQLPPNLCVPTLVPLVRIDGDGPHNGKLMRVKLAACLREAVLYVTVKNELLLQGSLPELGISCLSPRYLRIQGRSPTAGAEGQQEIVALHSGGTHLFVEYADGALFGLGSNLDGQVSLHAGVTTAGNSAGGATTAAKPTVASFRRSSSCFVKHVAPVPLDVQPARNIHAEDAWAAAHVAPPVLAVSHSGTLLLDHFHRYGSEAKLLAERPLDLPPATTAPAAEPLQNQSAAPAAAAATSSSVPVQQPKLRKVKF